METGLSKTLSYLLRHGAHDENLQIDEQGFVELEELLSQLRSNGWPKLDRRGLIDRLDDSDVERFERRGSAVRATYGHSIEVTMDYPDVNPDFPLYHGTSPDAWQSIQAEGLKPMNRQYVHLSRSIGEARRVGNRHHPDPIVLSIQPEDTSSGNFYRAGPVVLTEKVPPEWLEPFKK